MYRQKKIDKNEFLQRIFTIYEFSDSERIRFECLKSIDSVNIRNERLFKFLEEIVISETKADIRIFAMKLILNKFSNNSYDLVEYLLKSNESNEFMAHIAKIIGESIVLSGGSYEDQFSNLIREKILEIFANGDVISFEILWGKWCFDLPEEFWYFLLDLKSPGGFLELVDYFINDLPIYNWFFKILIKKFSVEQWFIFLKDSKFSGRLLFILFYLEKETSNNRFYQLINFLEEKGKEAVTFHENMIKDLLQKNNIYTLALILMFNWISYIDASLLEKILKDTNLALTNKIKELIINSQFEFLKYDSLVYSLISYLLHIYNMVDELYLKQFFSAQSRRILEDLLPILHKFLKFTPINGSSKLEKTFFRKYKSTSLEFLKILSKYFDIRVITS